MATIFPPPPPPQNAQPKPVQYLRTTDDLLARFGLTEAYHTHVTASNNNPPPPPTSPTSTAPPATTATTEKVDEPDDSGEKKSKNTYKALIKAMPGKHSFKKDDYLVSIISQPPKEEFKELPFFEDRTLEGFAVSAEGLKGWNTTALVLESKQQREDRKRRKELKKLAKMAQQQHLAQQQQLQQQQKQAQQAQQGVKRPMEGGDSRVPKRARMDGGTPASR